jgi:hypothetical protein
MYALADQIVTKTGQHVPIDLAIWPRRGGQIGKNTVKFGHATALAPAVR